MDRRPATGKRREVTHQEHGLYRREQLCISDVFFFSSRRRHTRFDCDWSSDVCSSDLPPTVSPCPFLSATPSRMSGPKATVPTSRTRTGTPFLLATGTVSRSLKERK